jgi:hypothetical protein
MITTFSGMVMASSEQHADSLATLMVRNTTTVQQEKTISWFGKISIQDDVNYVEKWNGKDFVLDRFVLRVIRIC